MSLEHSFQDRPIRSRVERRVGRFVSHADGSPDPYGHYEIETIPAPPSGKHVLVCDRGEIVEWSEIKCACSKCHEPMTFRFPGMRTSEGFLAEMMRHDSERYESVQRGVQMRDEAERVRRLTERHLYAPDERDDG